MKMIPFILLLLIFSVENTALPRFSLKKGGMCIDCHTNPTGGNLRNDGGWKFGKNSLPMVSPRKDFQMSNSLTDNILLGFDFRGQYLAVFQENRNRSDFQRMSGSVYTDVAISEKIDIFAKYDFIWGIWEAYATARILPNESYIKAGSFMPNFGIRLDDHTAYTRGGDMGVVTTPQQQKRGLIYEPRYVESGAEIGINISDFALFTASAGTNRQQLFAADPSYTASLQVNHSISNINFMAGASGSVFRTSRIVNFALTYPQVQMYGAFGGFALGDFSIMGEYDIADNYLSADTASSALMIEASYTLIKGLDAVIRYDRFDPSASREKDDLSRFVVGFEFHPYSFIEIRPQYRIQIEDPKIKNDLFLVQFHLWY
jgi:hypothetical protein